MNIRELINSCITDLDKLNVQGVNNMGIVLTVIQKLSAMESAINDAEAKEKEKNVQSTAE